MSAKYRYGHRPGRRRRTRVLIVVVVSLVILGTIGGLVALDIKNNQSEPVEGTGRTVLQTFEEASDKLLIDEPTFVMQLPGDWKEFKRTRNQNENSISWISTKKNEESRWLTLYIDTIPANMPINHFLPVQASGTGLTYGTLSDNCVTFTKGGSQNTNRAINTKPTPAQWEEVDFICNLPRPTEREVGTGSRDGVNRVNVAGPRAGKHSYFFLYTDHEIQPNYTYLYDAIESFRAK